MHIQFGPVIIEMDDFTAVMIGVILIILIPVVTASLLYLLVYL